MIKLIKLTGAGFLLAFSIGALGQHISAATGAIDILASELRLIALTPSIKLYPGHIVTISTSGSPDVNHQYWMERVCTRRIFSACIDWGDEPREQANPIGAERLTFTWQTRTDVVITGQGNSYKMTYAPTIEPKNPRAWDQLSAGITLNGYVSAVDGTTTFSRTPCTGRPPVCSAGPVQVNLSVDASKRLNMIEAVMSVSQVDAIDVSTLLSGDFLDPTVATPGVAGDSSIARLVNILSVTIQRFSAQTQKSNTSSQKIIDMATFGLRLSEGNAAIKSLVPQKDRSEMQLAVMDGYLSRGEFIKAGEYAGKSLTEFKDAFDDPAKKGPETARRYAKALRASGIAARERRAKNESADIREAIAVFDQGVSILTGYLDTPGVAQEAADLSVDAARSLNVLRYLPELVAAEERLSRALCLTLFSKQTKSYDEWQKNLKKDAECFGRPLKLAAARAP